MNNQGEERELHLAGRCSHGEGRLFIDGRCAVHMVISASGIHHEAFCTFLAGFFGQFILQIVKVTARLTETVPAGRAGWCRYSGSVTERPWRRKMRARAAAITKGQVLFHNHILMRKQQVIPFKFRSLTSVI
jgi:hypothetical protein